MTNEWHIFVAWMDELVARIGSYWLDPLVWNEYKYVNRYKI